MSVMATFRTAAMELYLNAMKLTTKLTYTKHLSNYIQYFESLDLPANALKPESLSSYVDHLHSVPMKVSTIKSTLSALCTFFKFGLLIDTKSIEKVIIVMVVIVIITV